MVGDILFDAGISPNKIRVNPKAVFITHAHGDHIKYMKEWMKRGVRCYSGEIENSAFGRKMEVWEQVMIGDVMVQALPALHDTKNALNFLLDDGVNRVLYEVDNAKRSYDIDAITHYIAEVNWDEASLALNNLDNFRVNRLRATHKSLEILLEELEVMDKSCLKEIYLAHMSDTNLNTELAKVTVQELTGVPVYFA